MSACTECHGPSGNTHTSNNCPVLKTGIYNPQPTRDQVELRRVSIQVCSICLAGTGGECHSPGCYFWMKDAPKFVDGEYELVDDLLQAHSAKQVEAALQRVYYKLDDVPDIEIKKGVFINWSDVDAIFNDELRSLTHTEEKP